VTNDRHTGRNSYVLAYAGGTLNGKYFHTADGKGICEDREQAYLFLWTPESAPGKLAEAIARVGWDLRMERAR
jgi:hypothetical protein